MEQTGRDAQGEMKRARRSVVWRRPGRRHLALVCAGAVSLLAAGAPLAAAKADKHPQDGDTRVVVMSRTPGHARGKVASHHGKVTADLSVVDAVGADVSDDELEALSNDPNLVVVPNVDVSVAGVADTAPRAPAAVFPDTTKASKLVADGTDGAGVTVAVLDTGITPLPDFAGRLVGGVDFSGEGDPYADSFGHGTFVSGLIAGNGASSQGAYMGEAPGASLVSIKVAGATGSTDLITVLKGIQWAVNNRDAFDISVLNISMGTPPFPSSVNNPLDRAVEKASSSSPRPATPDRSTGRSRHQAMTRS
jgi:serine protease AprX